jgi:peptide subunit release factor 1 (eRF1)
MIIVSNKSEEGEYFARNYGGIGAFLRYEFDSSYLK